VKQKKESLQKALVKINDNLEESAEKALKSPNEDGGFNFALKVWLNESNTMLTESVTPLAVTELEGCLSIKINNLEVELADIKRRNRAVENRN